MPHPSPPTSLDHLILFLPADPKTRLPKIPDEISKALALTPGGHHADGLTSNTLVVLADGCYIELICFVPGADEAKVREHWWGPTPTHSGWKDFCLTTSTTPASNFSRLQSATTPDTPTHSAPRPGARKRADGQLVSWAVTFPAGPNGGQAVRGKVPFFCHDDTPRELRVPISDTSARHASGVLGVKSLTVLVSSQAELEDLVGVYGGVTGVEATRSGEEARFEVGRVEVVEGLSGVKGPEILVRVARVEGRGRLGEGGFWVGDVVLWAKGEGTGRVRIDGGEADVGGIWVEYVWFCSSERE